MYDVIMYDVTYYYFTPLSHRIIRAGSGSGGSNPPFTFQIISQCIDDVCCAFVRAHLRRINLCSLYVWSAVELELELELELANIE